MELFEAIRKRRSIRQFTSEYVPDDYVNKILEAAILAPSAGNLQSWYFIVVRNKTLIENLAMAAWNQECVRNASLLIVVCCDTGRIAPYGKRGTELFTLHDTGAAIENMLLASTALGLGSVWVGAFDEVEAAELLGLNWNEFRPVAIIPTGFPAEEPSMPSRRSLSETAEYRL
ncbi:MAG: nitroreductase family protein [Candidatus Eremiobacterota bacterium]